MFDDPCITPESRDCEKVDDQNCERWQFPEKMWFKKKRQVTKEAKRANTT